VCAGPGDIRLTIAVRLVSWAARETAHR
jgi:hypothetical protein